jgi:hypothetical protein
MKSVTLTELALLALALAAIVFVLFGADLL